MSTARKTIIKEGVQNLKYELMFIKHKLDLVENLLEGLEEKVYSDGPISEFEDRMLDLRVKTLMEEYHKLHAMVNPEKISFEPEETISALSA